MSTQTLTTDPRVAPHRSTERRTFTETKLGTKTSEFYMAIVAIVGILVATYVDDGDTLTTKNGWLYVAMVAVAYVVSRGLAKLGTREPYTESETV